jgi:hypothetical protein
MASDIVNKAMAQMQADLEEAQIQLDTVSQYVQERIRVDNITDGFQKGYAQRMVQGKNPEVMRALGKLEAIIN